MLTANGIGVTAGRSFAIEYEMRTFYVRLFGCRLLMSGPRFPSSRRFDIQRTQVDASTAIEARIGPVWAMLEWGCGDMARRT